MAGAAYDGELSRSPLGLPGFSNRPSRRGGASIRFALATAADDAPIRRLLRENPLRGAITVSFEREPEYFRGSTLAGGSERTVVAFEDDRLVCMGRCTVRPCWLNGEIRRVGYLGELRLDVRARRRTRLLRGGYEFFHATQRSAPADFYFTSIAADNARARRVLERGIPGLPRYDFLAELTTLLIPTSRCRRHGALEPAAPAEISDFLNICGQRVHLAAVWGADRLALLTRQDLLPELFLVHRRGGTIVAGGAIWDQRGFRQTVVRGYAPALRFARPLLNAFAGIAGGPKLPPRGAVVAHAFLSPFAVEAVNDSELRDVVDEFGWAAAQRGIEFLITSFPSDHPHVNTLRRMYWCRAYVTRLYRVTWPGDNIVTPDTRPFMPDVAFL